MAVFNLFKMLALLLISLVAMTFASPIATSDGVSISVAPATKSDNSLAIPGDDVFADTNCYRCIYINLFCKQNNLTEEECLPIRCNDPDVSLYSGALSSGWRANLS